MLKFKDLLGQIPIYSQVRTTQMRLRKKTNQIIKWQNKEPLKHCCACILGRQQMILMT